MEKEIWPDTFNIRGDYLSLFLARTAILIDKKDTNEIPKRLNHLSKLIRATLDDKKWFPDLKYPFPGFTDPEIAIFFHRTYHNDQVEDLYSHVKELCDYFQKEDMTSEYLANARKEILKITRGLAIIDYSRDQFRFAM